MTKRKGTIRDDLKPIWAQHWGYLLKYTQQHAAGFTENNCAPTPPSMAGPTNNDLQNTKQKSKNRATRTTLKTGVNSSAPEG